MADKLCSKHDKEIGEIKTEFGEFKQTITKKIDELMVLVNKPIFNDKQVGGILLMAVVYTVAVMMYLTPISARSVTNEQNINKQERSYDKVMELLIEIKEVVDKNEGRNEQKQ